MDAVVPHVYAFFFFGSGPRLFNGNCHLLFSVLFVEVVVIDCVVVLGSFKLEALTVVGECVFDDGVVACVFDSDSDFVVGYPVFGYGVFCCFNHELDSVVAVAGYGVCGNQCFLCSL